MRQGPFCDQSTGGKNSCSAHLTSFSISIIFPIQSSFLLFLSIFFKLGSCCSFPQESSVAPYGIESRPCVNTPPHVPPLTSFAGVFHVHFPHSLCLPSSTLGSSLLMLFSYPIFLLPQMSLSHLLHKVFPSPSGHNPLLLPLGPLRCCWYLTVTCASFCPVLQIICLCHSVLKSKAYLIVIISGWQFAFVIYTLIKIRTSKRGE